MMAAINCSWLGKLSNCCFLVNNQQSSTTSAQLGRSFHFAGDCGLGAAAAAPLHRRISRLPTQTGPLQQLSMEVGSLSARGSFTCFVSCHAGERCVCCAVVHHQIKKHSTRRSNFVFLTHQPAVPPPSSGCTSSRLSQAAQSSLGVVRGN